MPETLTAPPPSVATTTPPPVAAPAPKPERFADFDAEVDRIALEPDPDKPPVEAVKPEAKVEPEVPKTEPEGVKEPSEDQKAKPDTKTEPDKPAGTAKELRAALDNTKKQLKEARAELETLKTSKGETPESKVLLEKLTAEEGKRRELESELGIIHYERTDDYKEKFEKPIQKAFALAYEELAQLKVEEEDGTFRAGIADDFNKLLYMELGPAIDEAHRVFGNASQEVLAHRRAIVNLNKNRKESVETHNKSFQEREKTRLIDQERQAKEMNETWASSIKQQVEKYPNFFGKKEGDDEGNTMLEEGLKLADLAFSDMKDLHPKQRVELHATIRNKAAGFDRQVLQNKRAIDKIAALEKELAGFRASEPGPSNGTPAKIVKASESFDDEVDRIARGG